MQEVIGAVTDLFRFPVKSLRGERLDAVSVTTAGIAGDRLWAFRDERRGEIASAKHNPGLLQLAATLEWVDGYPRAKIVMPDGRTTYSTEEECAVLVSAHLEKEVTLHGLKPADETAHYARVSIPPEEFEAYAREFFALKEDEPLPDLSMLPPEAMFYTSFPGTYFDVTPIHIVLTSELDHLRAELPDTDISLMRFRPNIVIDDRVQPLRSDDLVGAKFRVGSVDISVDMTTPRCAMTTHAQGSLPRAQEIMRKLVLEWKHSFGVYGTVRKGGNIVVGEEVTRLS